MIEDLEELNAVSFDEIAIRFQWNGETILLKREDNWEVENSNQNIFRGLTSQISGIKNGDLFSSQYYKNGKQLTVITAQYWGDSANWMLITAVDKDDLSYG